MSAREMTAHRGRPRRFEPEEALDTAMRVFWSHGYEGASMEELTREMGINRPSLYAAFGGKEALFRAALDRYQSLAAGYIRDAIGAPEVRETVRRLLEGAIRFTTEADKPKGCLLVNGALAAGPENDAIRGLLRERRNATLRVLTARFRRAQEAGDLAREVDPGDLAQLLVALVHGFSVQAASGVPRARLQRAARLALEGLPLLR